MTITPVTDDGGEITHFIAIKQDISERKRNEKEIIDARNAAEAANQIKSEFLANMSHEIRTPMNGIIGMTELTLDTELNPQQSEYLGLVKDSAHSLLQIINEILDFSKVEAGKLTLEEIPFQFQECVSQTIKTLALRASEKGLELLCEIHPDVPRTVIGDPGRLRQVLVNLTGNAIKFTESGEVHVEVSSEGQCDGRASVHFRVRDTGIGIPSEKQASIFEAFAQADSSSTRHYGGTGLGLTISSQLASLMGGRIWVESIEGTGSTFHFTAEFEQSSGQTRFMTTRRAVALKRQKILVVDDNKTNLRILDGVLARWNKEATLIADSSLALGALKQAYEDGDPYSLLLLDCQMPGLDGFMVAEKILNNPDLNVKVIMLTSAGHRGDAARCQELGIAGYLTKPVDQSELLDAILTALGASTTPEQQPELVTRHALREAGNKGRILVAEDNEVNQKLIISILEKHGYTIVLAENGTEAVDAFEQEAFDLILMDVRMPGMDGLQATVAIRATEKGRNIPIVALTAHAMHGDREMCLEAGMTDYVTKPVQTEELLSRIQALTGRPEHDLHPPEGQEIPTVVFDESGLLERTEGDMELALEVVQVFIDNSQRLITQMEDSFTAGDARALRDAAHSIKGSAGNFGAPKAQLLAEEVQFLAAHSEISEASPKLDELKREINVLVSELEQFVNGASS
jgi:CheY-like chemotaxis protein/HPt (histidine-containing phosphotransfer) domain-containing protein